MNTYHAYIPCALEEAERVGDGVEHCFVAQDTLFDLDEVVYTDNKACRDLAEIQGTAFDDEAEDLYLDKGAF